MEIKENEPLAPYTSLRIGGNAAFFVIPRNDAEVIQAIQFAKEKGKSLYILGNGSNLLISDDGVDGVVIKVTRAFQNLYFKDELMIAGGGVMLPYAAKKAADEGLGGLEFCAGIPGTIGGGLIMNAGIKDSSLGDLVERVIVLKKSGNVRIFLRDDISFGYRRSSLKGKNWIIISAVFKLKRNDREEILKKMREDLKKRSQKFPLNYPNAGSVFKNPEGKIAAQLIEGVGCKGMRIGDAMVSMEHANFIINLGQAYSTDVKRLIKLIQKKVMEIEKIKLELELILW